MDWKDVLAHSVEDNTLAEWRGRLKKKQIARLKELEETLHIPQAALVRLAIECFLPKLTNSGYTEEGILNLWNERKF